MARSCERGEKTRNTHAGNIKEIQRQKWRRSRLIKPTERSGTEVAAVLVSNYRIRGFYYRTRGFIIPHSRVSPARGSQRQSIARVGAQYCPLGWSHGRVSDSPWRNYAYVLTFVGCPIVSNSSTAGFTMTYSYGLTLLVVWQVIINWFTEYALPHVIN